ncbi:BspA family leucine-rich repeat surface protein [Bifidobacterium sp. ESL0690]|uniref:BspA family leucine-rich repeat surface protein n=1 Tax=Bifidobacterium sp. ESL0690 TaxID=2983214 RepID=UPI0023F78A36|nr:BspA family leucine-rich repeat surface protein [Bifidobacterium sp. ESL0690]WEV46421.1 BspA family leucine-rich repeat surface protein [Bifidobacterium sp. ESL0690]
MKSWNKAVIGLLVASAMALGTGVAASADNPTIEPSGEAATQEVQQNNAATTKASKAPQSNADLKSQDSPVSGSQSKVAAPDAKKDAAAPSAQSQTPQPQAQSDPAPQPQAGPQSEEPTSTPQVSAQGEGDCQLSGTLNGASWCIRHSSDFDDLRITVGDSDVPVSRDDFRALLDKTSSLIDVFVEGKGKLKLSGDQTGLFANLPTLRRIDISGFDTSEVTNMSKFFMNDKKLSANTGYFDYRDFNTGKVTDMSHMFEGCEQLEYLETYHHKIGSWDVSNVTDMNSMFKDCQNLYPNDYETPFDGWNTSKVTDMSHMFEGCFQKGGYHGSNKGLNLIGLDTSRVKDMSYMFKDCDNMYILRFGPNFDTSSVENMSYMFYGASYVDFDDLSGFNTKNVTDMSYMFWGDNSVNLASAPNFITSKVTNMDGMFSFYNGTTLDVSNFDTHNVTNMSSMFWENKNVKVLDVSHFNTSKVTNMEGMFLGCEQVKTLDVSHFDTRHVTNMMMMFEDMYNVTKLDVSNFRLDCIRPTISEMYNWSGLYQMFFGTGKVKSIDFSGWDMRSKDGLVVVPPSVQRITIGPGTRLFDYEPGDTWGVSYPVLKPTQDDTYTGKWAQVPVDGTDSASVDPSVGYFSGDLVARAKGNDSARAGTYVWQQRKTVALEGNEPSEDYKVALNDGAAASTDAKGIPALTGIPAVTFDRDGKVTSNRPVNTAAQFKLAAPESPFSMTKLDGSDGSYQPNEDYIFKGWNTSADGSGKSYQPGASVAPIPEKLYARWKLGDTVSFTVRYNPNSPAGAATGSMPDDTYHAARGTETSHGFTVKANAFAVNGWKFTGWNTKANGTGTAYKAGDSLTVPYNTAVKLYAQWRKINSADYCVWYYGNDGDAKAIGFPNQTSGCIVPPRGPNLEPLHGDAFTGNDANDEDLNNYPYKVRVADANKYWFTMKDGWKVVGFTDDNGTFYKEGDSVKIKPKKNAECHMVGWRPVCTSAAPSGKLYAQWGKDVDYRLNYDANAPAGHTAGGTGTANETVTRSVRKSDDLEHYTSAAAANGWTVEGWMFTGWNTAADGTGTTYVPGNQVPLLKSKPTTLYAQWKATSVPITPVTPTQASYEVRYNANAPQGTLPSGRMDVERYTLKLGENGVTDVTKYPNYQVKASGYAVAGYEFKGWNTKSDGTGKSYASGDKLDMVPGVIQFYAKWEKVTPKPNPTPNPTPGQPTVPGGNNGNNGGNPGNNGGGSSGNNGGNGNGGNNGGGVASSQPAVLAPQASVVYRAVPYRVTIGVSPNVTAPVPTPAPNSQQDTTLGTPKKKARPKCMPDDVARRLDTKRRNANKVAWLEADETAYGTPAAWSDSDYIGLPKCSFAQPTTRPVQSTKHNGFNWWWLILLLLLLVVIVSSTYIYERGKLNDNKNAQHYNGATGDGIAV